MQWCTFRLRLHQGARQLVRENQLAAAQPEKEAEEVTVE